MKVTYEDRKEATRTIVKVLGEQMPASDETKKIIFIYNHAMEDAISYIGEMAKHNPQYGLAFQSLQEEMKDLILVEGDPK